MEYTLVERKRHDVVSTVVSRILFDRFPTDDYIIKVSSFLL